MEKALGNKFRFLPAWGTLYCQVLLSFDANTIFGLFWHPHFSYCTVLANTLPSGNDPRLSFVC